MLANHQLEKVFAITQFSAGAQLLRYCFSCRKSIRSEVTF